MFKFLRKAAEKLGIIQPKQKKSVTVRRTPEPPKPTPKAKAVVTRPPSVKPTLNRRVIRHILSLFGNAKEKNVKKRVQYMTPEELQWTIEAEANQIRDRARQAPDREDDDGELLNPWWYK